MVSVCVITYNHARFIKQTLEGILHQKTNFSFEILIGEDHSSDGTREICRHYAATYPDKIRLFLRKREDVKIYFGKPIGQNNFQATLKEVKGKYIALCEGDDYWTDPLKLQKQVDYLESHPEAGGCFHDVCTVDGNDQILKSTYYTPEKNIYSQAACLTELRSSYATCSLVCRASLLVPPWPKWFQERSCDEFVDLMITRQDHELHFLPQNMGAYRIHGNGIWQGQTTTGKSRISYSELNYYSTIVPSKRSIQLI